MPEYFECMRCGHTSSVTAKPPKCPKCGSGAGVIVTRASPPEGTDAGDDGGPPSDKKPGSRE